MATISFTVLTVFAMAVGYTAAQEIFTDEVRKNTRMILCGKCADSGVKQDLQNFGNCVREIYPKEYSNIMTIRDKNMNDPDECQNKMVTELQEYARNDPAGIVKVMDCFRANVVADHLTKCFKSGIY